MPDAASHDPPDDHRCVECDYSLRGLPPEGRCPECGTPYDSDRITVYGGPLNSNHPITTATIGLLITPCLWSMSLRLLAALLALTMIAILMYMIHRRMARGRLGLRTRLVFHTRGLLMEPPLGRATTLTWATLRKCRLSRTWTISLRRRSGRRKYRLRASNVPMPYPIVAKADVWFTATESEIATIRRLLQHHAQYNGRFIIDA